MSWGLKPLSATLSTRRAKPSHRLWPATPGQAAAVEHLVVSYSALLVADPGAGKTAITLEAFRRLKEAGLAKTMLVIAPLRVCQLVWRQEGAEWTQFRDLRFAFLHGAKKAEMLKSDVDVWLINPEGCEWLSQQFFGVPLPFDAVTIDELTKFKNSRAKRFKKLRPRLAKVKYRWGLTGSLVPNGYMDLFGQMLILDDGAALGRYITHYRDTYFQVGFNGFDYDIQPGAAARIEKRIAPYTYRLPYTELPPITDDPRFVELGASERKTYEEMKREMLTVMDDQVVTAANGGAVYSKLKQMANGACYINSEKKWATIHDAKLDAIEELVEELGGQPLLIGYEFQHDLARLQERFPGLRSFNGLNEKDAQELERAWNNNELPYLAAHPASIGHGLNMQKGGACHIAWFSPTIDYELYDQFIRRIRRRGNSAGHVVNHLFLAKGTVDDTITLPAIRDKGLTQTSLLERLAAALNIPAAGNAVAHDTRNETMVARLSRQGGGNAPAAAAAGTRPTPKGWGKPAEKADDDDGDGPAPAEQRERVASRLTRRAPEPEGDDEQQEASPAERAKSAFSGNVNAARAAIEEGDDEGDEPAPEPAKAKPASKPRKAKDPEPDENEVAVTGNSFDPDIANLRFQRTEMLKLAFSDPETTLDDGLEIARMFMDFIKDG